MSFTRQRTHSRFVLFDDSLDLDYLMTMRDIETKLLRSFLSVAAERSFTAAAELLDCSQGTMSIRIRAFEKQIGLRLFDRRGNRVELTASGRELLPAIQGFVDTHDRLRDRIRSETPCASVRLGIEEYLGARLLTRLLRIVPQAHEGLDLRVRCQTNRALKALVQARSLDLAVIILCNPTDTATELASPGLQWVAARDFAFDDRSPLPLALQPAGCSLRDSGIAALDAAGASYRVLLSSPSGLAIWGAVESGAAITILPDGTFPRAWRVVGPALGLPPLGHAYIQLVERLGPQSESVLAVRQAIGNAFETMYRPVHNSQRLKAAAPVIQHG